MKKKTKAKVKSTDQLPFDIFYQDGQGWIERDGSTGCEPASSELCLLWEILQQQRQGLECLKALQENLESVTRRK